MNSRRGELGPAPGVWLCLGLAAAAVAFALLRARHLGNAHGYTLWPPSPSTLMVLRHGCRMALAGALFGAIFVELPWRVAARRAWGVRGLATTWAWLAGGGFWVWRGLLYNRYEIRPLWRSTVERFGVPVPRALTDGDALRHNGLLTLGALAGGIALWLVLRWALPRLRFPSAPVPARVALILLFALLTAGAVRPANWGRPRPTGPDLILVSLDAVRADRLGSYGYASATTPALDRLAEEAVLFRRAYCQEPWTLTSHMSMLTGLQPDAHGLDFGRALSPAIWTLPEQLQDAGYRTWGSVYDCYLLDPGFGYGAGFDHYEVSGIPAAERVERALTWLAQDERPSFLFLHLYDPHSDTGVLPYEAPKELLEQFAPGAAQAFDAWTGRGGASESLRLVNEGEMELPEPLRAAIGQLYDAGLAATDAAVGRFLNGLRASGRFDDALILVLSDHGESLGERNHFMHEQLMEATLRIPFLLKWPGGRDAGSLRDELVETVDVAPTFLAAAGLEPPALVQGIDLHRAPADWPRRAVLSRSGPDYALTTVDSLRILHRWTNAAAELSEIRRIGADPSDGEPLPGNPYEIAYPWLEMLEALHHSNRIVADRFRGVEVQANAADQDLLRSLGYVD